MNKTFLRPASPALVATVAAALLLGGCANMSERQKGTAVGAGIGAGVGAVIGKTTGGKAGTGAVVGGAIGAVAGNLWSKRMEDKRREMEQATAGTGVTVDRTDDNQLRVNLPGDISFDSGRSNIRPDMAPILSKFAQGLDGSMNVQITGHTDSQGSEMVNLRLSIERAEAVVSYLSERGIALERLSADGQGEADPLTSNATEEGRARNRRVELLLRAMP